MRKSISFKYKTRSLFCFPSSLLGLVLLMLAHEIFAQLM